MQILRGADIRWGREALWAPWRLPGPGLRFQGALQSLRRGRLPDLQSKQLRCRQALTGGVGLFWEVPPGNPLGPWQGRARGPGGQGEAAVRAGRALCPLGRLHPAWGSTTGSFAEDGGAEAGLRAHTGPRCSCSRGPRTPKHRLPEPRVPRAPPPGAGPTPASQLSRGNSDSLRVT